MRIATLAALACLAVAPCGARAAVTEANFQLKSAADLAALCGASAEDTLYTAARNFCHGYAVGVYRMLANEEAAGGAKTFCFTDPVPTRDQVIATYVGWMSEDPKLVGKSPEDSVLQFLQGHYPCGGTK